MATTSTLLGYTNLRLRRYVGLVGGFVGWGAWGVADQALVSACNFVTMVVLARSTSPVAFGAFTLAYTALLVLNSLQSALVTQPHNVLGTSRRGEDYVRYTATTAVGQLLLGCAGSVLALVGALIARGVGSDAAALLLAVAPASFAWQSQEFVRRIFYTEGRLRAAFANDVISYGGQVLAIAVLWQRQLLGGPSAFVALTLSSLAAAILGGWLLRDRFSGPLDWSALAENWAFGKWLAGGEIGYWLSSQVYLYLTAALLGAAAAGGLRASQLLLGPLQVFGLFLASVLPIRFARSLAARGQGALHDQLKAACLLIALLHGGYIALVAIWSRPLLGVLYDQRYDDHATVVVLYALYLVLFQFTLVASSATRALRQTQHFFSANVAASVVALLFGWILVAKLGVEGAVVGMIATALIGNAILWRAYFHARLPAEPVPRKGLEAGR